MTEMSKLLPCPFCGSAVTLQPIFDGDGFGFRCVNGSPCIGSGLLQGFMSDSRETAIAAWNRRVPMESSGIGHMTPVTTDPPIALRSAEVVEDDGRLWSMLRNVLEQGAAINMDYAGGKYKTYEEYAARIDVAAHERVDLFRLSARPVSAGEPLGAGMVEEAALTYLWTQEGMRHEDFEPWPQDDSPWVPGADYDALRDRLAAALAALDATADCEEELQKAERELTALRATSSKDGAVEARYQWLRDQIRGSDGDKFDLFPEIPNYGGAHYLASDDEFDEAIDAHIAAAGAGEGGKA